MINNINCVNKENGKSWCGKDTRGQWAFVDMQHAKGTIEFGSAMSVCEHCLTAFNAENQEDEQ